MHNACYLRAWRKGELDDSIPSRIHSPETREKQNAKYFKLVGQGLSQRDACKVIGIKVATMQSRLFAMELTWNGRRRNPALRGNYEAIVERYWTLRDSGFHDLSMIEIAAKIGISDQTLYRALRKKADYEW
jgi:DNA-directed RNA polymerase specialized sigma24 family protein